MTHMYWNDWYSGWGWFLWFGIIFLLFSSIGNWGYTYRAHQRFDGATGKTAAEILKARYANGELTREQFTQMSADVS